MILDGSSELPGLLKVIEVELGSAFVCLFAQDANSNLPCCFSFCSLNAVRNFSISLLTVLSISTNSATFKIMGVNGESAVLLRLSKPAFTAADIKRALDTP